MESFNLSQKLVMFISIFSLFIQSEESSPSPSPAPAAAAAAAAAVRFPEQSVSIPPESSSASYLREFGDTTAFSPSNADPPSDSQDYEESDAPDEKEQTDSDTMSKTELEEIAVLSSDENRGIQQLNSIDPKIKSICDYTDHPHLCLSATIPFLKGKTDMLSVVETAIKMSKNIAKYAYIKTKETINSPSTPDMLSSKLQPCLESYDDILYCFEDAMDALKEHDIDTVDTMLSGVITDVGDCQDSLSGVDSPFPLNQYSDRLANMTSNCLVMVKSLN